MLRAVAGDPAQLQIMYGAAGERRLTEMELDWLPGYEGSTPVRIGNAASEQFQLDVYGEVLDALYQSRRAGLPPDEHVWRLERLLVEFVADAWKEPDEGIWEIRGPRQHFTHSKIMAWVAVDRAVRSVEEFDQQGPVERWRVLRDEIKADVLANGVDAERQVLVQHYETEELDASLLMAPLVGFLEPDDPIVANTVAAI
ncbi:glucoamylase, partial [cyanobacterium TDX16]